MFDPERLLGQMIGGALGGAFGGGGRRGRRHSMFSTGDIGGKAAMGVGLVGIAIAAFEHFNDRSKASGAQPMTPADVAAARSSGAMPPPPPPPGSALPQTPPPPPPPARAALGMDARARDMVLMVQAMIAAAAADGRIDEVERGHILQRAESAGVDAETRDFLERELDAPLPMTAIVARTRPELAGDVYAASLVAIDADTDAEKQYLDALATALKLDAGARSTIHQQLGIG